LKGKAMTDNLRHLQLVDAFKERIDRFIRSNVDRLTFDKSQYDIDVSNDGEDTKYIINLHLSDHGHQIVHVTPRQSGFSVEVQVIQKGRKTIPQFLISMFHEDLLGEYLDNSSHPLKELSEGNGDSSQMMK
jgi:hypothetical protein